MRLWPERIMLRGELGRVSSTPVNVGEPGSAGFVGGYAILGKLGKLGKLGSGGMGAVYLGRSASGRRVAVKVVHAQDEEFRVRFRQEVAAAEKRLPSIVLVRDAIVAVAGDTAFSVRPDRPRPAAG